MEISFSELLLIAFVALIVFGPEQLPEVAKKMGRLFGKAKAFRATLTQHLHETAQHDSHEK